MMGFSLVDKTHFCYFLFFFKEEQSPFPPSLLLERCFAHLSSLLDFSFILLKNEFNTKMPILVCFWVFFFGYPDRVGVVYTVACYIRESYGSGTNNMSTTTKYKGEFFYCRVVASVFFRNPLVAKGFLASTLV